MATLHIKQTANNSGIRLDEFGSSRYFNIAYEGQGNIHFYHQNTIGQWMGTDGTWKHNSDISLKKDISSMNNILDKVIQLNPVHFTWKDSNLSNIGFIAQEVQQIFPELVSSVNRNGDNLKGLSYDSFGVIAIAAIKEMKSKYDQEIKILQEQIKILQEQIAKILTEKSKL
ncbi:MAG: tail fiber domain-containing protein [Microcystis aeruginosa W13-13]|nr:tail fiber domain-containing protein [Microcystis aeruginosa W13-16]NCQ75167.1 tail fiber domain-containing protein [Microcystis aeruginosa W13-13]NCS45069.1 tail fiber domain-containing protein [Microcystis aeruginosa BS11-05]NCS53627.1 tail fiber domain-containing protein [Microcystis aeruginosa G13-05]